MTDMKTYPVAWLDKESGAIITAKLNPLLCEDGFEIPLYAEQPAPVAFAITDDQILEAMRQAIMSADGGYVFDTAKQDVIDAGRALLAEVARLNGVKP